jgi:hypothetical protein
MSEENNNENNPELPETRLDENENPDIAKEVELDNELKSWFIEYVGKRMEPEDGVVTVGMVVQTFAEEFPEFLMVVAEENWIRGYRQGVADSEEGVRRALEEAGVEAKITLPLADEAEAPVEETEE